MLFYKIREEYLTHPYYILCFAQNRHIQDYMRFRFTPCHNAAAPMTSVPVIAEARRPAVLLNIAPAINPDNNGVALGGIGVQLSSPLQISPQNTQNLEKQARAG